MRLRRATDLWEYTIGAKDTDIGMVHDFYFDDEKWTIRYIVVETGEILPGRKVLISPIALRNKAWSPLHIWVNLTKRQVQTSPSIDLHKPISRQHEIKHHDHFGWPYYWPGKGLWGSWSHPAILARAGRGRRKSSKKTIATDAHLRSVREVIGYHVSAVDGQIGHVEDFLFDGETWGIRSIVVDTRNLWAGKNVLISPKSVKRVSWKNHMIYVNLPRERIRKSPSWDPTQPA